MSGLFLYRKLHLFSGKSTKTAATRAALFDPSMHQIVCRLGLTALSETPQVYLEGLLLMGEEMGRGGR